MSDEIITAESLQQNDADQTQDNLDSPDEETKDENLETTSEEDANESEESEGQTPEDGDEDAENADSQTDTDEESEEDQEVAEKSDKPDIPEWVEKRLKRERRKHEREMDELRKQQTVAPPQPQVQYDQTTQMQDPFTGQIVDINSVEGQVALKLQQVSAIQEETQRQQETQQTQESFKRKLDKGRDRFDDFDEVTEHAGLTRPMLEAAYLSDDTDGLLYNLAKYKPSEIDRISKLSPDVQKREMVLMEAQLKQSTKKKIVKKVPEPPSQIKGSASSMTDESDMSYEDLYKRRRKAQEDRYRR